ncbi:MAG: hypothetical protein ACI9VT_003077 [Psychroserpens sp.]|jgi:hypothetical protein
MESINLLKAVCFGKGRLNEENASSLIAYLLNPKMPHGIGSLFLHEFVKCFEHTRSQKRFDIFSSDGLPCWDYAHVVLEDTVFMDNRSIQYVDVVIHFYKDVDINPVFILAVENKISDKASTQGQLDKQAEGLINKYGENCDIGHIYLTPKGLDSKKVFDDYIQNNTIDCSHFIWGNDIPYMLANIVKANDLSNAIQADLHQVIELCSVDFNPRYSEDVIRYNFNRFKNEGNSIKNSIIEKLLIIVSTRMDEASKRFYDSVTQSPSSFMLMLEFLSSVYEDGFPINLSLKGHSEGSCVSLWSDELSNANRPINPYITKSGNVYLRFDIQSYRDENIKKNIIKIIKEKLGKSLKENDRFLRIPLTGSLDDELISVKNISYLLMRSLKESDPIKHFLDSFYLLLSR